MKIKTPTFSGKNFRQWSLQARALLMVKQLWGIVNGTDTKSAEKTTDSTLWDVRNDQAMGYILTMVDPAYHYVISDAEKAQAMWKKLNEAFGTVDRNQYDQKLTEWVTFSIQKGEEPSKYGARLLSIAQELNILASELKMSVKDDSEVVHRLLTAAESAGEHPAMVQVLKYKSDVSSHFVLKELQYAHQQSGKTALQEVYNASLSHSSQKNGQKQQKFGGSCYWCGKKGRRAADCRAKKAGKPKTAGTAADSTMQANAATQKGEQAFVAKIFAHHSAAESTGDQNSWILDTGATRHMTGSEEWFMDLQEVPQRTEVILGDNRSLAATKEGNQRASLLPQSHILNQIPPFCISSLSPFLFFLGIE